jgi:DNA-binding transcriptional ArsR family regulator
MSDAQTAVLESTFKTLANGTRLRILHALVRAGELCVSEIADAVGMKSQAVSNQLQRLADRGIVETRREGVQIHYRIVDPCVISLLKHGWCLIEDTGRRKQARKRRRKAAAG